MAKSSDGYFARQLSTISLRMASGESRGLRPPQFAAACAVTSHFFRSPNEPALVVMPTGTGKTGVMTLLPFLLQAKRVLVITPGVLLRDQIMERMAKLNDVIKAGLLPKQVTLPKVYLLTSGLAPPTTNQLAKFDIVVGNIQAMNRDDGIAALTSPALFDLVLVDEAHHSSAQTWNELLAKLRHARQVLFTATPFRGDNVHISAQTVFFYSIEQAKKDAYFGDIRFAQVIPEGTDTDDIALAKAAQLQFDADRANGYRHLVLIRTSGIKRAKEIADVYAQHTRLKLVAISSDRPIAENQTALQQLEKTEVDGAICINMLGEGLDIPQLKIAALHAPHKSLAVTLQFVGRLARVSGTDIGPQAVVLAIPQSIKIEGEELYDEEAAWPEVIHRLARRKIERRERNYKFIEKLRTTVEFDSSLVNPTAIQVGMYARVFHARGAVAIPDTVKLPYRSTLIHAAVEAASRVGMYIFRTETKALWYRGPNVENVAYDIFVVYFEPKGSFIFVTGSARSESVLRSLAKQLCPKGVEPLPMATLSAVTNGIDALSVFSVGMRSRGFAATADTYRMLAGPAADRGVSPADGQIYDRGHFFARGDVGTEQETVGASSNSVIWSAARGGIADFQGWCETISARLQSARAQPTHSGLDLLSSGRANNAFVDDFFAAIWDAHAWSSGIEVALKTSRGRRAASDLAEVELLLGKVEPGRAHFFVVIGGERHELSVDLRGGYQYESDTTSSQVVFVVDGVEQLAVDFLEKYPISFLARSGERVEGPSVFGHPLPIDLKENLSIHPIDWAAAKVDIESEKDATANGRSLFDWVKQQKQSQGFDVIFCDDGALEIADFICVRSLPDGALIQLVHCKASSNKKPGARVKDFEVVCAQALRSCAWFFPPNLLTQIEKRAKGASTFTHGDLASAKKLLQRGPNESNFVVEVEIVQPGLDCKRVSGEVAKILLATDYHVRGNKGRELRIFGSA
jgi:superfamily II DNA or RNA helicase